MSDRQRQLLMLSRMGLGPVWKERQGAAHAAHVEAALAHVVPDRAREMLAPRQDAAAKSAPIAAEAGRASPAKTGALPGAPSAPFAASPKTSAPATRSMPEAASTSESASSEWAALQLAVANCAACGLCQGRNRTVFGVGDPQATWLFVGEGPGRQEDLKGEPFVGPAGKLLDNMLRSLGLGRDADAYIANVVKCRPTGDDGRDRPPTPEEIAACLPFLQQQIEAIQPDVIVALGRIAAVALLGLPADTPVGSLRGKLHQFQGRPMVVTYHPAYLLRQPADKAKVWRDLCMARAAHASQAGQASQASQE